MRANGRGRCREEELGSNAGSRQRFWSLVSAVGTGYVIVATLILLRTAGL